MIEDHSIIDDLRTTALVSMDGSIDWCCYPKHDSPSIFAAIVDRAKGDPFQIASTEEDVLSKQFYWLETNVLVTRFLTREGIGEIIDSMSVGLEYSPPWIIRQVKSLRCSMRFRLTCNPAFNYGRDSHTVKIAENGDEFHSEDLSLGLVTEIPLEVKGNGIDTEFCLNKNESVTFILRKICSDQECGDPLCLEETRQFFEGTVDYWQDWLSHCIYKGR